LLDGCRVRCIWIFVFECGGFFGFFFAGGEAEGQFVAGAAGCYV